jgi:hypothetical protein
LATCAFDTTFLLLLTDDLALAPQTPVGAHDTARDRLTYLIETLDDERMDVIVPTPVLTELLIGATADVGRTLDILKGLGRVRIEGFGERAAIECALLLRRTGRGQGPKAKVKFDHQIVAIAKVAGADTVYSDDAGVKRLCEIEGLACRSIWDLPPRPIDPQSSMDLKPGPA